MTIQQRQATFWAHTGPQQQLDRKCYDDFGDNYDYDE